MEKVGLRGVGRTGNLEVGANPKLLAINVDVMKAKILEKMRTSSTAKSKDNKKLSRGRLRKPKSKLNKPKEKTVQSSASEST